MKKILSLLSVFVATASFSQLSLDAFSTNYTIDFDNTVAGVNNGQFQGAGFDPVPSAGLLDSDGWSVNGLSDGDLFFGGTGTTGDYAAGISTGAVTGGGVYAFEVQTADYALGVQPTGSDFTPGEFILKVNNNTGGYLGDISISYELWILQNGDRGNSFELLWSINNTDWETVENSYVVSNDTADVTPVWELNTISVNISASSIAPDDTLYLKWYSDDQTGSGSRDEFAIDDIVINATQLPPTVTIDDFYYRENEDGGLIDIQLTLKSNNGLSSSIKVKALSESTASTADYTMATGAVFTGLTDETINFTITLTDDGSAEQTEYIAIYLEDSTNGVAGAAYETMVYILDDDMTSPVGTESIKLDFIDSIYVVGGSAEISAFDPTTDKLYTANSTGNTIEVFDLADPYNIALITSIDVSTYGDLNSIDVYNDTLVIGVANSTDITLDGSAVFFQGDGTHLNTVTAGANPDMVVFTPDHSMVLVANEGEPNDAYTTDPEGSITIIDISAGVVNAVATQVNFNAYDSQMGTLMASGVRIFGPGSSVSEDLEPEYITVDETSSTAWITLQENNAIAILDIQTATITDIVPLGLKDHSLPGNGLDITNDSDTILIANWPVYGMYMPDAIAHYSVGGSTYLITANEGDSRDYGGYSEEDRLKDLDLEDSEFGQFEHFLMVKENAGRVKITYANGDFENDGDYDSIFVYGGRSFSIWDAAGNQVYDSGDDFEQILAHDANWNTIFNCSNDNVDYKDRSDDKGPEPEGVAVGIINDTVYAFITLERMGGVMVYDVTNPIAPNFVQYVNNRNIETSTGDLAPEGIIFIDKNNSPIDTALIIVSNEVSGTVSVYKIDNYNAPDVTGLDEETINAFVVYPNPANEELFFSVTSDVEVFDLSGKVVLRATQADRINIAELNNGMYMLKTADGSVTKFIKQ